MSDPKPAPLTDYDQELPENAHKVLEVISQYLNEEIGEGKAPEELADILGFDHRFSFNHFIMRLKDMLVEDHARRDAPTDDHDAYWYDGTHAIWGLPSDAKVIYVLDRKPLRRIYVRLREHPEGGNVLQLNAVGDNDRLTFRIGKNDVGECLEVSTDGQ